MAAIASSTPVPIRTMVVGPKGLSPQGVAIREGLAIRQGVATSARGTSRVLLNGQYIGFND
jgi:hypothetical protein